MVTALDTTLPVKFILKLLPDTLSERDECGIVKVGERFCTSWCRHPVFIVGASTGKDGIGGASLRR